MEFNSPKATNSQILISSISGNIHKVVNESFPISEGKNSISIDFHSYNNGMYIISIITSEEKFSLRAMKVK
ncbi:MAG: T9SS type A sorting domain-containing protein [Bacteroidales bacterium]|nr:T9SS type A sorting domain-containing protein [Bacteroidales bacterium]